MNGPETSTRSASPSFAIWLALLAAAAASAGSLWLSLGMGMKACPLCLYQRSCVFAALAVLLLGLALRSQDGSGLAVLALAPSDPGFGVGPFHCYLEYTNVLESPSAVSGYGS